MSYLSYRLLGSLALVLLAVLAVLAGCGAPTPLTTPTETKADAAVHPAAADSPGMEQGLTDLSPEDQALARKQKVCPVSGETLGSMGSPYKTTVKGRTVFLCCSGCEAEIQGNPDKYLAKLDAANP